MTWNADYFSKIGYLSVLLWIGMVLLCLIYWKMPARLLCTVALGLAVAAFACAKINSETYVNRIQLDRTEELAKQAALEDARQQAILDSRGEEVAQIRFAEDGAGDFLDRAGMDEADLKYFESQGVGVPAWKNEKKTRSSGGAADGSLESEIAGDQVIDGVESEAIGGEEELPSMVMSEVDMVRANRFDLLNLRIIKILIVVGILVVLLDYLRRANLYGKASFPLPLPSSLLNALTPMPALVISKKRCRNSARSELTRLAKRGDSFLYLTNDPARAAKLPSSMQRFPIVGGVEDLIPVTEDIDDEFVFDTVWYGRSSFTIDSDARAQQTLEHFLARLAERKTARAKVAQTAHLVWDLDTPMPESMRKRVAHLAGATGFSVFLLRDKRDHSPKSETGTRPASAGELLPS